MTLLRSEEGALFYAESEPQSGAVADVTSWAARMFTRLDAFLRRPEFPGIVLTRLDATTIPEFKAQDGMLIYAGAGTLGPQEGLYIRESGVWKKIAGT